MKFLPGKRVAQCIFETCFTPRKMGHPTTVSLDLGCGLLVIVEHSKLTTDCKQAISPVPLACSQAVPAITLPVTTALPNL